MKACTNNCEEICSSSCKPTHVVPRIKSHCLYLVHPAHFALFVSYLVTSYYLCYSITLLLCLTLLLFNIVTTVILLLTLLLCYPSSLSVKHLFNLRASEKDHLGDRSPEKDRRQRPTPRQPVRKPSSESSGSVSQLKIQKPW